jgi:hypothetical protein
MAKLDNPSFTIGVRFTCEKCGFVGPALGGRDPCAEDPSGREPSFLPKISTTSAGTRCRK